MRPAIAARSIAATARATAVAETLRRRLRTVVGKTSATSVASTTTDAPRVVLERDISPVAWQFLQMLSTAAAGDMAYFDGSEWMLIAAASGADGDALKLSSGEPKWQA